MSTYRHFQLSLQAEFRRKIYRQVRALYADLEELKKTVDEADRLVVLHQIRQRIYALEQAAHAVEVPGMRIGRTGVRGLGTSTGRLFGTHLRIT
jgi:hypothetical protein